MRTKIKKLALVVLISACVLGINGCVKDKQTFFGAFNDETYVWESFNFTTNQVQEIR